MKCGYFVYYFAGTPAETIAASSTSLILVYTDNLIYSYYERTGRKKNNTEPGQQ